MAHMCLFFPTAYFSILFWIPPHIQERLQPCLGCSSIRLTLLRHQAQGASLGGLELCKQKGLSTNMPLGKWEATVPHVQVWMGRVTILPHQGYWAAGPEAGRILIWRSGLVTETVSIAQYSESLRMVE